MENPDDKKISNSGRVADHLANERTFLAWIRTAIALMGFGFVIVKFALFIRELSAVLGEKLPNPGKGYSAIIGVVMVALGAIMAALSYIHYLNTEKRLRNNEYTPSHRLLAVLTLSIVVGSVLLVLYLLPNIK